MSRLEEIKQELRDSGQLISEVQIDWLAREKHRHEKLQKLPELIREQIKTEFKVFKRKTAS